LLSIDQKKLIECLRHLGLKKSDIVFTHSSLGLIFGKQKNSSELLFKSIKEIIGNRGTLVAPAFTLECSHGKIFDKEKISTDSGSFGNWLIKKKKAIRSNHPLHSVVAIGYRAKEIIDNISPTSFGDNSVFKKLVNMNAKCLLVGVGIKYVTLIHQIEEENKVPYRFFKTFKIKVKKFNKIKAIKVPYYARYLNKKTVYDFKKMNLLLKNEKLINSIKIGWGQMSLFNFRSFYDLFNLHIKRNPFFVIKKKYFAK
tara:strand:+ start:1963 stop:2727 length:765 start_codon:yes stop_codon:yes gene_type:complete